MQGRVAAEDISLSEYRYVDGDWLPDQFSHWSHLHAGRMDTYGVCIDRCRLCCSFHWFSWRMHFSDEKYTGIKFYIDFT